MTCGFHFQKGSGQRSMFYEYSDYRKRDVLSPSQTYFIPGYTGHCPTLKFQFGKCYGACTREIIQTLTSSGMIRQSTRAKSAPRKQSFNLKQDPSQRKYILGYTGYIPGMYRHHGQSFYQIAEKCEKEKLIRKISFDKKPYTFNSCNVEIAKQHQYSSKPQNYDRRIRKFS